MDKIASQNNGVKFLIVAVGIFSRFVRVQTMKTKYAKVTLQMISQENTPENFRLIKEQIIEELLKRNCKEKDIEVYSIISQTITAFAERASQSSKHIIYRNIDDHGKKFIHKLS